MTNTIQNKAVILLGVVFSILCIWGGVLLYKKLAEQERTASFDAPVTEFIAHFNDNLKDYEYVLHSENQLFDSSENVDRIEFESFSSLILEYNPAISGIGIYEFDVRAGAKSTLPELKYWIVSDDYAYLSREEMRAITRKYVDMRTVGKVDDYATELFAINDSQRKFVTLVRSMPQHKLLLVMVVDLHRATGLSISNRIASNFMVFQSDGDKKKVAFSDVKYSTALAEPFKGKVNLFNQQWEMVIYPPEDLFNRFYILIPVLAFLFSLMVLYIVYFAVKIHKLSDDRQAALQDLKFAQEKTVEAEKIGAMGGLVAGIAHEVNTPLGISITSCSHVNDLIRDLKEDFDNGELDEERFEEFITSGREVLGMALGNLKRASKLISSFKKIDVINADDSATPEMVDVADLVENFAEHYRQNAMSTKVTVNVEVGKRSEICTYPTVINQVLDALASNSEVHGFANKEKDCVITIRVTTFGKSVMLKFADNGEGVANQDMGKIFDPFFTTRRGAGNAGLGLSVVYNLVKGKLQGELNHGEEPAGGLWVSLRIKDLND